MTSEKFKEIALSRSPVWPINVVVEEYLSFIDCTGLIQLPQSLVVIGSVNLSNYTDLIQLPQDLVVEGNLYLMGCTGLTSLPQGLVVGNCLFLAGCTGLTSISGKIKDKIYLNEEFIEKCSIQNLLEYKDHFEKNFQDLLESKVIQEKIKNVKLKTRFHILKGI